MRLICRKRVEHGQPPDGYLSVLTDVISGEGDPTLLIALDSLGLSPDDAMVLTFDEGRTYIYDMGASVKS